MKALSAGELSDEARTRLVSTLDDLGMRLDACAEARKAIDGFEATASPAGRTSIR